MRGGGGGCRRSGGRKLVAALTATPSTAISSRLLRAVGGGAAAAVERGGPGIGARAQRCRTDRDGARGVALRQDAARRRADGQCGRLVAADVDHEHVQLRGCSGVRPVSESRPKSGRRGRCCGRSAIHAGYRCRSPARPGWRRTIRPFTSRQIELVIAGGAGPQSSSQKSTTATSSSASQRETVAGPLQRRLPPEIVHRSGLRQPEFAAVAAGPEFATAQCCRAQLPAAVT